MATQATIDALQKIADDLKETGWGDAECHSRLEYAHAVRSVRRSIAERAGGTLSWLVIVGFTSWSLASATSHLASHWAAFGMAIAGFSLEAFRFVSGMIEYLHDPLRQAGQ